MIEVGFYDSEGKMIETKMCEVEKGIIDKIQTGPVPDGTCYIGFFINELNSLKNERTT